MSESKRGRREGNKREKDRGKRGELTSCKTPPQTNPRINT